MAEFKLQAGIRTKLGRSGRETGIIPGVVYGNNFQNINVALKRTDFLPLFKEAGTSNLIDLAINGENPLKTLVSSFQLDPITLDIIHIDFFKVNMKEKIKTEVPLNFINQSPAAVNLEGSLITAKDAVEVECLPSDLISEIDVDLSVLDDFEKDIRVSDLKVPGAILILDDPEEVVAHVEPPRSEAELESLEEKIEEDVSKVEVEAEKKEDETEEDEEKKPT